MGAAASQVRQSIGNTPDMHNFTQPHAGHAHPHSHGNAHGHAHRPGRKAKHDSVVHSKLCRGIMVAFVSGGYFYSFFMNYFVITLLISYSSFNIFMIAFLLGNLR